ncbi:MAG: hypothetical protein LAP86_29940 [Acidobacteriia bacterium]|nr:hypothetical protein [Terriglobia bacterium]
MIRRLRRAWDNFNGALELRSEYDITFWDAWKITRWEPHPIFESDTPPDPHEMAHAVVTRRQQKRQDAGDCL